MVNRPGGNHKNNGKGKIKNPRSLVSNEIWGYISKLIKNQNSVSFTNYLEVDPNYNEVATEKEKSHIQLLGGK